MNIGELLGPAIDGAGYKGVLNFHGLLLGIEHATGDVNPWSKRRTKASYGEFPGTLGNDGDPVDFLLGHNWDTDICYVLQQRVPNGQNEGAFDEGNGGEPQYDEDKVVLGAKNEAEARDLFDDYYHGSGRTVGGVIVLTLAELVDRIHAPDRQGFSIFKGDDSLPITGGPNVARFFGALDRVAKSLTPPSGFSPIPGSKHGGYRKHKARGYEYWYPDEHKEGEHPDWEAVPGSTGTSAMKPGQFALVMGHGSKLFKWTPEHEGDIPADQTWMTDLETGEHVAVLTARVQPARGKAKAAAATFGGKRPLPKRASPTPVPRRTVPVGDIPRGPAPQDSPTSDVPSENAPRVPVFEESTAKPGTILHNIEHGAYGVLRYKDAGGKTQVGMYVPKPDQKRFIDEFRGLTHSAVTAVARNYRVREKGAGGGVSPEYQDLYSAAQLGLVQAVRAYKGRVPFAAHAHRYMRTYAAMEARDSLGRGLPISSRIRRLTEGYLASVNRAQVQFQTDSPTDEQVATAWHLTKKHVYQRDLGRYVTGAAEDAKVVDQAAEQLPLEDWQVRTPTGEATGKLFPGKLQLVEELRQFTAGDRTKDSEWMEEMEVAAVLPRHAAVTMPVGTALHLRQEVDTVLAEMDPAQAQVLTLRWGLDDSEPLELHELAIALKLAPDSSKQAGIIAASKLIDKAKASFQAIANRRKAEVGKYIEAWSGGGSSAGNVVVEKPSPDSRSYAMLAGSFKGDNDSPEQVNERVSVYTALAVEGDAKATEAALIREARGEATPAEVDALRTRYFEARDKQRLRAFHLQTHTVPVDPATVRDFPAKGTDADSVTLYADDVANGYMRAIARRGMPGFTPAAPGTSGPSRVWSDEKLARFLGIPVERLASRAGTPPKSAEGKD